MHFGAPPVDLRPIVRDAVQALGYFRPDAADELAAIFTRLWPRGISATMLLYNDLEDLSPVEKAGAGLGKGRMPRELWNLLSEVGRAKPHYAVRTITSRVISTVQRARFDRDEATWSSYSSRVQFIARATPELHCDRARELNGSIMARQDRFPLPMPDCDREWCPCRWDHLLDDD